MKTAHAPLEFQLLDVAITDDNHFEMYGRTADGRSVSMVVDQYETSFYVRPNVFVIPPIDELSDRLGIAISKIVPVQRKDLYNYSPMAQWYHELVIPQPFSRTKAHRKLASLGDFALAPQTWNTTVDVLSLFLIHADIDSCGWVRANYWGPASSDSTCDIIAHVLSTANIERVPAAPHAPVRILSFDIECFSKTGAFPTADRDPLIQIACVTEAYDGRSARRSVVFCLHETNQFGEGVEVRHYDCESGLIKAFVQHVRDEDPDMLTGYNILNFDIPYIVRRAERLGISEETYLGRRMRQPTTAKRSKFSSKGQGTFDTHQVHVPGRVVFDLLVILKRDGAKLRSYKLNAVAQHYLGDCKDDVHHSEIGKLFEAGPVERSRLAHYCWRDAVLPLDLIQKQHLFLNNAEQARVCCVPLNYLVTRGQQVKVLSQIAREAHKAGYVIPNMDAGFKSSANDSKYQGATVLRADTGYYTDPVVVLDFAALYPSIIRANNLCFSTLIAEKQAISYGLKLGDEYIKTPTGDCFVTPKIHRGLLPQILQRLNEARAQAKSDMKNASDPHERAVHNGRQLALKISANSVYGATGASTGKLYCLPIAASTTAFGRGLIERTSEIVQAHPFNAQVVYGDTVRLLSSPGGLKNNEYY